MSDDAPFVHDILHPSDFSAAAHVAFVHALALVAYRRANLTVLHVVAGDEAVDTWIDSPQVRTTLERWGLLEENSPRSAVFDKLAVRIAKINVRSDDPVQAILRHLDDSPADLIVLATEGRTGLPRWMKRSVAEGVARRSKTMTMFVPQAGRGFVSPEKGEIAIRRVLVPVDHRPAPTFALTYAARAAVMSHEPEVEIDLLRVGEGWPDIDTPALRSCSWNRLTRRGNVVEQVVEAAHERGSDLIVMATAGSKGILGALRGSVTENVLRRSPCPVLAVPERGD